MDTLRVDIAYALRTLRRHPLFALAGTSTLTIGAGAAIAVFAVVHGVLLKPLPIRDQERVVVLRKEARAGNETLFPFAVPDLRAYAEQTRTLEAVAGVQYDGAWPVTIRDGDRVFSVSRAMVSGDFFRVLDVRSVAGRALNAADDVVGGEAVAVISHSLWQRQFGGDPSVVGRMLRAERAFTVVGVVPWWWETSGRH